MKLYAHNLFKRYRKTNWEFVVLPCVHFLREQEDFVIFISWGMWALEIEFKIKEGK